MGSIIRQSKRLLDSRSSAGPKNINRHINAHHWYFGEIEEASEDMMSLNRLDLRFGSVKIRGVLLDLCYGMVYGRSMQS